jgi:hypothetical protein
VAALSVVGTGVELAMLRHWGTPLQVVPWFALAALAGGLGLMARPTPRSVRLARAIAVAVAATGAFGVVEHVVANYDAAPLDYRYGPRWAAMSAAGRWWAAATKAVGPAPPLAPAVLAWAALCLWFATHHHPVRRRAPGANPNVVHSLFPGSGVMLEAEPQRRIDAT